MIRGDDSHRRVPIKYSPVAVTTSVFQQPIAMSTFLCYLSVYISRGEERMALKITLKPHEKMIIAGAAITNGSSTAHLSIENNVPILRERDILKEKDANSPARRIYFIIQLMYLDPENLTIHHEIYRDIVLPFIEAVPSSIGFIDEIGEQIRLENYYKALKWARKLIDFEQTIISDKDKDASLP
jgi:flagellar biosynthesis repressor protein FlbT